MYWIKACETGPGSRVELAWSENGLIGMRNSALPTEVAWFTRDEWRDFINQAKQEDFDI
jgi:hypothetical protein